MKKLLLIFLAVLAFAPSFASHNMGGQITARHLGGTNYEVTLIIYRDYYGIPLGPSYNVGIQEIGGTRYTTTRPKTPILIGSVNGLEQYACIDTVSLSAGKYKMEFSDCCRSGLSSGNSEPFNLSSELTVTTVGGAITTNSTPVFLNQPISLAQVNTPYSYNPMPYDADGDSLAWSLVPPIGFTNYTLPTGSAPFVVDSLTGLITWTPSMSGIYAICVLVSEYRNGIKIGEVMRDMHLSVMPATAVRPTINTANIPTNARGIFLFDAPVGYPLNVSIIATATAPNVNYPLNLSATGEPFFLASNPAVFPDANGVDSIQSIFSWSPNVSQIRKKPYIVNFRVLQIHQTDVFGYDFTGVVTVRPLGVANQNLEIDNQLSIYPNPSNGSFAISFLLEKPSQTSISVQDMATKTSRNVLTKQLPFGKNVLLFQDLNLAKGVYLVQITTENKTTTQKLVVE